MVEIKKEKKFSDWYLNVILKADLIDYGPVKGTIIFKPYAYRIWEKLQAIVDEEIKKLGVKNLYFPIFIPESFLRKEKEHFKGFTPEVAVVTYAGGEELKEKLVVRPTSETIMYPYFAKWIKSYRDLPILINQWTNVIRWEKRPFPFIRNTEFLWQEGHTAHKDHKESLDFALKILSLYEKIYQEVLCIYGFSGQKSASEKFAGALATYTYEVLLADGKVLQGCTSHDLGQNFSKVFSVRFQDKDKKLKYVWQTSWGITTRAIGAIVGVHGDDNGLILPSKIAPYEIVIVPIYDKKNEKEINKFIEKIKEEIKKDIFVDDSEKTPGYKFNEWELKGIPLRIEIGSEEIKNHILTCFRRDKKERFKIKLDELKNKINDIFAEMDRNLFERSKNFTERNTFEVRDYKEFKKNMETKRGFILAPWCEKEKCEEKIKEEIKATTRCKPKEIQNSKFKIQNLKCIYCRQKAKGFWLFAQSY
jgi:prolyl-tRNA synthetase